MFECKWLQQWNSNQWDSLGLWTRILFVCIGPSLLMFECMWLQEWKDGSPYVRERGLKIFFHCIPAQIISYAKDVVQLLSTRSQVGSFWIR